MTGIFNMKLVLKSVFKCKAIWTCIHTYTYIYLYRMYFYRLSQITTQQMNIKFAKYFKSSVHIITCDIINYLIGHKENTADTN